MTQALDDKAVVGALGGWVKDTDPMLALNAALMTDGVVIDIAANSEIERPLQIAHVVTGAKPTSTMTRSLVRIGAHAKVTLVESFVGHPSAYQVNDALIVEAGDGVNLQHVRLMEDAECCDQHFNAAGSPRSGRDIQYVQPDERLRHQPSPDRHWRHG